MGKSDFPLTLWGCKVGIANLWSERRLPDGRMQLRKFIKAKGKATGQEGVRHSIAMHLPCITSTLSLPWVKVTGFIKVPSATDRPSITLLLLYLTHPTVTLRYSCPLHLLARSDPRWHTSIVRTISSVHLIICIVNSSSAVGSPGNQNGFSGL